MLETLDGLFKKHSLQLGFTTYDNLERFRKSDSMAMKNYIIEFEHLHSKPKQYGLEPPDGTLAYKLLINESLLKQHIKLVKATITMVSIP